MIHKRTFSKIAFENTLTLLKTNPQIESLLSVIIMIRMWCQIVFEIRGNNHCGGVIFHH